MSQIMTQFVTSGIQVIFILDVMQLPDCYHDCHGYRSNSVSISVSKKMINMQLQFYFYFLKTIQVGETGID